ncbi:tyrosine-protein phosphatase [Phocaeicola faecalis]|uniref:tyrosine-protein phosphatase n=1 Tax=Phocaeicola faecalis TaxID=2786956 RepID=UPI001F2626FE|nr:CpsB/CapC family capsule biosynthesis tyrosine phosphatase [Phocaeicola faecalis]
MTDCHSHLLPGVDDGVKTLSETLEILKEMEKQGIAEVWFTPHIMEDIPNKTADLKKKFAEVQAVYQGNIRLYLAAENMLDNLFEERLENDDLLPIEKDGKLYLLVETSYFNPPIDLYGILKRIQQKGYYPLLAHPERYEYMTMKDYKVLRESNILFQLNLPALSGMYGKNIQKKAKVLYRIKMYDVIGCDIHSMRYWEFAIHAKCTHDISVSI